MFSSNLEQVISASYESAREARHESLTLTHMALALLDMPEVAQLVETCHANVSDLRKQLSDLLKRTVTNLPSASERDTQPTEAFQRTLQRAVYCTQVNETKTVSGVDVLSALLNEKDADCVSVFEQSNIDAEKLANHPRTSSSQSPDPKKFTNRSTATISASTEHGPMESTLEKAMIDRLDLLQHRLTAIEARLETIEKKLPDR